jgi:dynein light intermediate chain, axonemal
VRDEIKMVIKSNQTLYVSSLGYGMRKYLLVDQEKTLMEERINELEKECVDLEADVRKMENNNIDLQKSFDNQRREEENKHKNEMSVEKAKMVQQHSEALKILDLVTEKERAAKAAKAKEKKDDD